MLPFSESDCLWYRQPAERFEEALPLGNGSLGAMVYGDAACAHIGLNHDEFWTGGPGDALNQGKREAYLKAQELALAGKYAEAQAVLEKDFCVCARVAAYQPLGDLYLENEVSQVTNYRRALFLREGLAQEEYEADGVRFARESFVSYPAKCFCMRVRTDRETDFVLFLKSQQEHRIEMCADGIRVCGHAPLRSPVQEGRNAWDRALKQETGMRFCFRCVVETNGRIGSADGTLRIGKATELVIYVAAATSFAGFDKDPLTEGKDECGLVDNLLREALARPYDAHRATHIADVAPLYDRVFFSVGSDDRSALPTDERLRLFDGGNGQSDAGLYALLFRFGRYLTIAGSRPGSRTLNLQGIWNARLDPPWSSNYTVNINIEMNYFATLAVNLAEMTEPLDDLLRSMSENGKKTAQVLYGAGGFVCHHNSDVWAHTVPIEGMACYSFWPFGSGWLCRHLFEKYEYTNDLEYLADVYPILREAARFYLDLLIDVDGYRAVCPATSPENNFLVDGMSVAGAKTTTMAMSIVRELFQNCLRASELLSIEDEVIERIRTELPRLLPLRMLADGRMEEWYFGDSAQYPEQDPHHRHLSHLYGLYPGHEITTKTTALAQACKRSLDARGDDLQGWSHAWKGCLLARLGEGDLALRCLQSMFRLAQPLEQLVMHGGKGLYANFFAASHGTFQIDFNLGYLAAVCEMLVQTDGDEIRPLPALPTAWKTGEVRGLRIKGNRLIDLKWEDGNLCDMKVYDAIA